MILLDDFKEEMSLGGSYLTVSYDNMGTGRKPRLMFENLTCIKNSDANGAYAKSVEIRKLPITHQ